MITKEILLKTFNEVISKHSDFLYNIESTLKSITDSKEEYQTLHDDIWRFWKQTKSIDHEQLIMKGTDGTFFENINGEKHSVGFTDDMINFANETLHNPMGEKLLYTMHNHPSGCCYPSMEDLIQRSQSEEKYQIILSKDGLFISKKTGSSLDTNKLVKVYGMVDNMSRTKFSNQYSRQVHELEEEYPSWFDTNSEDSKLYRDGVNQLYTECNSKNLDTYVKKFNEKLHTKSRNVLLDVYHVKRSPRE